MRAFQGFCRRAGAAVVGHNSGTSDSTRPARDPGGPLVLPTRAPHLQPAAGLSVGAWDRGAGRLVRERGAVESTVFNNDDAGKDDSDSWSRVHPDDAPLLTGRKALGAEMPAL